MRDEIKRTEVISPQDVVGMRVGEEDRVNSAYAVFERLIAQVRTGIDEYRSPVV